MYSILTNYVNYNFGDFKLFGVSHVVILLLLLAVNFCIIFFLPKSSKYKQLLLTTLASSLILFIFIFHFVYLATNRYSISQHLPLHLCSLGLYSVLLALLTRRSFLIKLSFFWSFIGAFIAILLPELGTGEQFPNFRFIEFMWSHFFMIVGVTALLRVYKLNISYKNMFYSWGILVLLLPIIYYIDTLTNGNYMFLMFKPNGGQMNFLPDGVFFIPSLILMVFTVFNIQWLIYKVIYKKFLHKI
jgi:hypothetical integral membrane protein (TIGR02206 family)